MVGTARLNPDEADDGSVALRLRELVEAARDDVDRLCDEVAGELFAAARAPVADADVRAGVLAGAIAAVEQLLDVLADPGRPAGAAPPAPLAALAAGLARRGADAGEIAHVGRAARRAVWHRLLEDAALRLPPGGELVAVLDLASSRLFARTDAVVDGLLRHWLAEREHAAGGAAAQRAAIVRGLLSHAGGDADLAAASAGLGFALDRPLCAAVLWGEDGTVSEGLEALAGVVAGAGGGDLLAVPGEPAGLWAWVGADEPPDVGALAAAALEAAHEGQHVALGTPGHGLAGFRGGHAEAQAARRIAELSERGAAVVRYDRVEAVCLMADDPGRLARFVERTLGPLALPGESAARLRRTLRAWLAAGGSAPAAAARLGVHKNTVLYRVHRAAALLPRPLEDDRLAVELALSVAEEVGLAGLRGADSPAAAGPRL